MNKELYLIKLLLKYNLYVQYGKYVQIPKQARELLTLYHTLELLHQKYPDTDKSVEDLLSMVYVAYPNLKEVERFVIEDLCKQLKEINVNEEILHDLLRQTQMRSIASTLALNALDMAEGRATFDEVTEIYNQICEVSQKDSLIEEDLRCYVTDDLLELEQHTITGPGLSWRLNCLNRSLGPLRPGDFGFVFARPESGKTTFLADQCTFMAGQTDRPIIWFNNEEQGEKVRLRTYQAALGVPLDELWRDKNETMAMYRKATNGNLVIYDDASIYKNDAERVIEKHKPILVVFDQIDKIKGFKADRQDLVFGQIYQWAREIAKEHQCAVIGICQSDGTGEGVRWLTMSHVAEAKTSKQAEADWILGIGKSHDAGTEDVRFLNISKNKLLGDENTHPQDRHGRFTVFIRPEIARYEDLDE